MGGNDHPACSWRTEIAKNPNNCVHFFLTSSLFGSFILHRNKLQFTFGSETNGLIGLSELPLLFFPI